jgi:polar amino acid transport system substrate-binding protein
MTASLTAVVTAAMPGGAMADKLDEILTRGKLLCGVVTGQPPIGYRDENNNIIGYDPDICADMATALGVELELVETRGPARITAVVSDKVDVGVSAATNSLERAKVVAFSKPYQIWDFSVAVRKDNTDIRTFEDLKGQNVGGILGTTQEIWFKEYFDKWNDPNGKYTSYGNASEQYLALKQGKIDAFVGGTIEIGQIMGTNIGSDFKICCKTPFPEDWTGIMVKRQEQGFLNWVNLFLWHEVKTGRLDELYRKWWGYPAPSFAWPDTHGY